MSKESILIERIHFHEVGMRLIKCKKKKLRDEYNGRLEYLETEEESLDKKLRDEVYYEIPIKSYVHDILNHFVEIDRISSQIESNDSEEEIDIIDEIILQLNRYYEQRYKEMVTLLDNTRTSLGTWSGLDREKRLIYADIIEDFRWLVEDYFSTTKEEYIQIRMWNDLHNSVFEKRYEIDNKIDFLMGSKVY